MALFGRKINNAENQLAFIRFLRWIADGEISPEEAVKAYHGVLQQLGVTPHRSLNDDMVLQTSVMSYGGSAKTVSIPPSQAIKKPASAAVAKKATPSAEPDFGKMSATEKVAWNKAKWDRILGG